MTWWLSTFSCSFKHFIWFNFEDWRTYFTVRVFYSWSLIFVSKSMSLSGIYLDSFNSYIYRDFLVLFNTVFSTSLTLLFLAYYLYLLTYYPLFCVITGIEETISFFTIYGYLGWWLCVLVFKISQLKSAYSFAITFA